MAASAQISIAQYELEKTIYIIDSTTTIKLTGDWLRCSRQFPDEPNEVNRGRE